MSFKNDSGNPPPLNSLGIHWLRGSVPKHKLDDVISEFSGFFGEFEDRDFGYWVYDKSVFWPAFNVALNYFSADKDTKGLKHGGNANTRDMITFEVPGKALDMLGDNLVYFIYAVGFLEAKIGRIDVYYDDYSRIISPRKLHKTVFELDDDDPNYVIRKDFTGFRTIDQNQKADKNSGLKYDCVAFGSRGSKGSGAYLRIYDKYLESGGDVDAIRWELELTGGKARAAFEKIYQHIQEPDSLAKLAGGLIGGCIDFQKRDTGDKNLDRCERYEFWQRILDQIGKAKFEIVYSKPTIHKAKEYTAKQTINLHKAIKAALGPEKYFEWWFEKLDNEDKPLPAKYVQAVKEYKEMRNSREDYLIVKDKNLHRGTKFQLSDIREILDAENETEKESLEDDY